MTILPHVPEWKTVLLSSVGLDFISGGTPATTDPQNWDGDIPWTTTAPIGESDTLLESAERSISVKGLESSAANIVPSGSLLVGTRVGVGKAVVNGLDVAINQDLTGVVLNRDVVNSRFLAFQFKSERVQNYFQARSRGTTIKGVSRFDLERLPIELPPVPEQRAIAHILESVRQSEKTRQRELALERERKAALMEHLFTHGTRGEKTKQTDIRDIPNEWDVSALADVAVISSGGTPDRTKPEYWGGAIPWVTLVGVTALVREDFMIEIEAVAVVK